VRDVQEQSQHKGGSLGWKLHSLAFPEQVMLYDRSDSLVLSLVISLSRRAVAAATMPLLLH
jgi:hypothetical protein